MKLKVLMNLNIYCEKNWNINDNSGNIIIVTPPPLEFIQSLKSETEIFESFKIKLAAFALNIWK